MRKRGWHGRASRHGGTVLKLWQNSAQNSTKQDTVPHSMARPCRVTRPGRAAWLAAGRLSWPNWLLSFGFMGTFVRRFFAALNRLLCPLFCWNGSSFCFFDKVPENIERYYMSKKCAKRGRFDSSLTRSNVKTQEKMSQIGAKNRTK